MIDKTTWLATTALAALAIATVPLSTAQAAGFQLLEQSAVAQGSSYAGAGARAEDPSTLFYNPAGITHLKGYQISISGSGIFPNGNLQSGTATTGAVLGNRPYTGTVGTNSGIDAFLPSMYATAQLSDTVYAGLAITSPFGLATQYSGTSIARYYALTTSLKTVNIGPSIAWRPIPQLSVAVGLNIEKADAHLSNAVDFGAVGAVSGLGKFGLLPGTNTGIATVRGDDAAFGWNAGILYEPLDGTRLGLTYRSSIFHKIDGSLNYEGVPALLSQSATFQNRGAVAKVPEPLTLSFSAAQDIGPVTLLGSATYTGWSIFKNLQAFTGSTVASATPENFRDTYALSLGADYHVNDQWTLRAGTLYDQTPVQKQFRTPRIADNDRYWASGGVTYMPMPNLALTAAYSHIFARDSSVNLVDAGPNTPNFLRGNLKATYNLSIDIVSMQASYKF